MKKALILIMVVLLSCSFAFAETVEVVDYSEDINFAFQPTLARYDAMGQSGLALMNRNDSYYSNPAALANKGFGLSIPTVAVTYYNVYALASDPNTETLFKGATSGDKDATTKLAFNILSNLGSGYNTLAKIDLGLGLKLGVIGLGTNAQVKIHSLNKTADGSVLNTKLIPEVNAAQTVALGLKFIDSDNFSLSAGVAGHFVYKVYFQGIGGSEAIDLMNSDNITDTLLWSTPAMGGYAIPIDVGVTFGLIQDQLTLSATVNNLNGKYHMKSYEGAGYLINSLSPGTVDGQPKTTPADSTEFTVTTPWELNFGVAFAPKVPVINPVVTADLVDMYSMIKNLIDDSSSFRASDLLLHLNAGAELNLLKMVSARVGVNRGFMSLGAGIWLPFAQVDVSYGWQEFGEELGDKPVDSVTVKFNLGYDKH